MSPVIQHATSDPIEGDDAPPLPPVPSTPHQAYVAGLEAAQRGDDLVVVVHTALRSWSIDVGLGHLAELITCAALGFHAEEARS